MRNEGEHRRANLSLVVLALCTAGCVAPKGVDSVLVACLMGVVTVLVTLGSDNRRAPSASDPAPGTDEAE